MAGEVGVPRARTTTISLAPLLYPAILGVVDQGGEIFLHVLQQPGPLLPVETWGLAEPIQ